MKIVVYCTELRAKLRWIKRMSNPRHSVFRYIKIKVQDDVLVLSCTDSQNHAKALLMGLGDADHYEYWQIAVTALALERALVWLRGPVTLRMDDDGNLEVSSDGSGVTTIHSAKLTELDFPEVKGFNAAVAGEDLAQACRLTEFAATRDRSRFLLNGADFQFANKTMVIKATDGHRMASVDIAASGSLSRRVLNIEAVTMLSAFHDQGKVAVGLSANKQYVVFSSSQFSVAARVQEFAFPDDRNILAQIEGSQLYRIPVKPLMAALRKCELLYRFAPSAKLSMGNGVLSVHSVCHDYGEYKTEIQCIAQSERMQGSIHMNPAYIRDMLKVTDQDEILFYYRGHDQITFWKPTENSNVTWALMPMRGDF